MLKKTLLSLAVAGIVATGSAMLSSEASATTIHAGFGIHGPGFSIDVGPGYHGRGWRGHRGWHAGPRRCKRIFVRKWSPRWGWYVKKERRCFWPRRRW